ncbi:MAG: 50S ribosomal protein L25 [Leptonema sp. (in: bacteria)]
MNEKIILKAEKRVEFGKNSSTRLRKSGKLPANLLEKGKSTPISLELNPFEKLLKKGLLPSMVIQVELEGNVFEVLPKEIQRDPVTGNVLHVDLYKMTKNHKFHLHIPVELVGISKGVKAGGALEHYIQMLKIRTTPENLKEKIEVNIENLGIGDVIRLKDLDLPSHWDILLEGNPIICKISTSRVAKETETQTQKESK